MSKESLDARLDEEGRNWIERAKLMDERMERERADRSIRALILLAAVVGVGMLVAGVLIAMGKV